MLKVFTHFIDISETIDILDTFNWIDVNSNGYIELIELK